MKKKHENHLCKLPERVKKDAQINTYVWKYYTKFLVLSWRRHQEELVTQMFGKRCSEYLSKIHSEPCQTSNMEFFAKIVNEQKP